jgi:flagellin
MSSILTNNSAMSALQTLQSINKDLNSTQGRISSGLSVQSGKDNAAYFQISETMKGDSSMYGAINEGLTLTKNSVATARLGAESFQELAQQFVEKVAFAQGAKGGETEIENDLAEIVKQMEATVKQSTFNGDDLVNAGDSGTATATVDATTGVLTEATKVVDDMDVVTGVSRSGGSFDTTTMKVDKVDLTALLKDFGAIASGFAAAAGNATTGEAYLDQVLIESETTLASATTAATQLGQAEKSIEGQQEFLGKLVSNIDAGVGSMIDANMEEEAARLQSLQVQQQLATQSLSIANQAPQNILSLFR